MISALLPNYARADLAFERGEGAWLWTVDGRRFLDFGSGIATASLGHGHPQLAKAIAEQAAKVMHVSNLYRIPQAEKLAQRLVDATFADSVFFCNSGAEANEGMIKMMRRAMFDAGKPERFRFIVFEGAFHGRTLATLAATGNAKYLEGFGPIVDGFDQVPFNNMNAVRDKVGPATAGIIVEPIQGEGGVRPADMQFLRDLRAVCDEYGLILGFDEVQSGMGRTGKLFAYEWAGIVPDVMSAAKGIGGGFPLGAVLAKEQFAKALKPGTHGTTFGGNPLACAAGNAVLDVMLAPGFLEGVQRKGNKLRAELEKIVREFPQVFEDARGMGLLQGMKCVLPQGEVQAACVAEGLMAITAGDNVLRLAPPLVVTDADLDEAFAMLRRAARRVLPMWGLGPPVCWPSHGTSSICAISTPRRCGRCWMLRRTTSAAACRRVRWPARRWR
jgi:acetylornithine/N-succinyldiaminopimelate aminotransferase